MAAPTTSSQNGVSAMPSKETVASTRMTKPAMAADGGASCRRPAPNGRTTRVLPRSSAKGAKRAKRQKNRAKGSALARQAVMPKSAMPVQVRSE